MSEQQITDDMDQIHSFLKELQKSIMESQDEIPYLQEENVKSENNRNVLYLKKEIEELSTEKENLQTSIQDYIGIYDNLYKKYQQLNGTLETAEDEKSQILTTLNQFRDIAAATSEKAKKETNELKTLIQRLDNEIELKNQEIKVLRGKFIHTDDIFTTNKKLEETEKKVIFLEFEKIEISETNNKKMLEMEEKFSHDQNNNTAKPLIPRTPKTPTHDKSLEEKTIVKFVEKQRERIATDISSVSGSEDDFSPRRNNIFSNNFSNQMQHLEQRSKGFTSMKPIKPKTYETSLMKIVESTNKILIPDNLFNEISNLRKLDLVNEASLNFLTTIREINFPNQLVKDTVREFPVHNDEIIEECSPKYEDRTPSIHKETADKEAQVALPDPQIYFEFFRFVLFHNEDKCVCEAQFQVTNQRN